jgi:hypothetical protein
MEQDGFKIAIFKTEKDSSEKDVIKEFHNIDIHDIIGKLRIGLAQSMDSDKKYNPDFKLEEKKETNEKNVV